MTPDISAIWERSQVQGLIAHGCDCKGGALVLAFMICESALLGLFFLFGIYGGSLLAMLVSTKNWVQHW